MKELLFTIVVPAYNCENTVLRCLSSILAQTYKSFELIVINDGSTDNTMYVCDSFLKDFENCKVVSKSNGGCASARNYGMYLAKGDFIIFVDADDFIELNLLDNLSLIINAYKVVVVAYNIVVFNIDGSRTILRSELPYERRLEKNEIFDYFLRPYFNGELGILPSACNKAYDLSFLKDNNLKFDENLVRSQDYWFSFEVYKAATSVYCLDFGYYNYSYLAGSQLRSYKEGAYEFLKASRERLLNEASGLGLSFEKDYLDEIFVTEVLEVLLYGIKNIGQFKSYGKLQYIYKDSYFLGILCNARLDKYHIRIIRNVLLQKWPLIAHILFILWSIRFSSSKH